MASTSRTKQVESFEIVLQKIIKRIEDMKVTQDGSKRSPAKKHTHVHVQNSSSPSPSTSLSTTYDASKENIDDRLVSTRNMMSSRWAPAPASARPGSDRKSSGTPVGGTPPRPGPPPNTPTGPSALRSVENKQDAVEAAKPAQQPTGLSLKKRTVRVVGAAAPTPTEVPPKEVPPTAGPVQQAAPKVEDGFKDAASQPASKPVFDEDDELQAQLDRYFSRLQLSKSTPTKAQPSPIASPTSNLEPQAPAVIPTVETKAQANDQVTANTNDTAKSTNDNSTVPLQTSDSQPVQANSLRAEQISSMMLSELGEIEHLLITKALEAFTSTPITWKVDAVYVVKEAAVHLTLPSIEMLKDGLVSAAHGYLKGLNKTHRITVEQVQDALTKSEGNLFWFASQLIDLGAISVTLDEFAGLCRSLMSVLGDDQKPVPEDSKSGVTAWPAQEKRKKVAGVRTCILKGVGTMKNIHDLQALVWGGPIEFIEMARDGSGMAVVKFLTPEACEAYFDATLNGIPLPDGSVVTVEQKAGVNSTNDVINQAIAKNVTRCVRAVHADKDWNAFALMGMTRGPERKKRDVDVILSGEDSHKRFYIEFRFANLYDAINFRRSLANDEDWEMCTITHVADPCATAKGPHFEDVEEAKGKLIVKGFT